MHYSAYLSANGSGLAAARHFPGLPVTVPAFVMVGTITGREATRSERSRRGISHRDHGADDQLFVINRVHDLGDAVTFCLGAKLETIQVTAMPPMPGTRTVALYSVAVV
jgi:hypothetical protein